MILDLAINIITHLCTQMPDRTFNKLQIAPDRLGSDIGDFFWMLQAINSTISTIRQISLINVIDQILSFPVTNIVWQIATNLWTKRKLTITISTSTSKTVRSEKSSAAPRCVSST